VGGWGGDDVTNIPYLDEMWSITTGCGDDMASPGCLNCYARRMFGRNLWKCAECGGFGRPDPQRTEVCRACDGTGHQDFTPTFHADRLDQPLHWRKPKVVGVSFMGDLFHEAITDDQRDHVMAIVAGSPRHTFLVLTKRALDLQEYFTSSGRHEPVSRPGEVFHPAPGFIWPPKNLWLGVTVCNQDEADRNIPILLATPAAKRWVSLEPMLAPTRLGCHEDEMGFTWLFGPQMTGGIDWVVLGGETGPGARTMEWSWALDVYDQCRAAGVPFYWKQAGDWLKRSERELDDDTARRVFEMAATREMPMVSP
jgi:protein gp37